MEFPAVVNAIKESTEAEGEETILATLTPILTRPSIISQYSSESPRESIEYVHKRASGLIISETDHSEPQETSFIKTTQDNQQIMPLLPLSAPPVPIPSDEDGLPIQTTLPLGFQELVLTIKRRGKRGMGITLVTSGGITRGYPLIRRVLPKGLGIKSGLKQGDRLISINSQSLQGLTPIEVMNMISDAPSEYSLVIWRDPNYDVDTSSSMYSESHTSVSDLGTESSSRPPTTDSLSSLLSAQKTKPDDDNHLSLQQEDLLSNNELPTSPPLEVPIQLSSIPPANLLPPPPQRGSSLLSTTELPPPPTELPPPPPRELSPPIPTELLSSPVPAKLPPPPTELPPPVPTELSSQVPTELPPPPPRESPPPVPTELPPPVPTELPPPPRESPPPVPTELPPPPRESPPPVPTELPPPPPVPTELPPLPPRESPPPVPTELPPPPPPRESPPPVPTELPPPPPPRESPPPVPTELPPPSLTEISPVSAKTFHRKSPPRPPPPYGSPKQIK